MNSSSIKVKKFFSNRNTVAIICAVLAIVVLYVGYSYRVNSAIQPVEVAYAKVTIQPRTEITDDMIGTMTIASAAYEAMEGSIIQNAEDVIGKYSAINTAIPEGSMFYVDAVTDQDGAVYYDYPEDETLTYLNVTLSSTVVNSILPGKYIDIYIHTTDSAGIVRVGKFLKNIKVLAVKDSSGNNVFEDSEESRTPAYLVFSLPTEQYTYFIMAKELNLTIVPRPANDNYAEEIDASEITSDELIEYIDQLATEFSQTVAIVPEDEDTSGSGGEENGE